MGKRIDLEGKEDKGSLGSGIRRGYQVGLLFFFLCTAGVVAFLIKREQNIKKCEEESQEDLWHAQQYFEAMKRKKALHGDGFHLGFLEIYEKWGDSTKAGKLARFYIAAIYMQQKKYQKVIDLLDGLVIDDAVFQPQVLLLRGDAYSELGQYEEALRCYQAAAAHAPNPYTTPRCYSKIASILLAKGDHEGVRDCYQRICDDFPESPDYAVAQKYLGYYEQSIKSKTR